MIYVFDVIIIVMLFFLFASSHSILANYSVKQRITEKVGEKIAYYRFFYNVTSLILFAAAYLLSPKPNVQIYDLQFPYDLIIFSVQFAGIIGFFWASSFINISEFIGISQIKRYLWNEYKVENLDEYHQLVLKGPFKFSRHPIYFFSIIVLGFRASMDLFYLVFFLCMLIYFYVGSVYEEKNLEKRYGQIYINYKSQVPRLIPNLFIKLKL